MADFWVFNIDEESKAKQSKGKLRGEIKVVPLLSLDFGTTHPHMPRGVKILIFTTQPIDELLFTCLAIKGKRTHFELASLAKCTIG